MDEISFNNKKKNNIINFKSVVSYKINIFKNYLFQYNKNQIGLKRKRNNLEQSDLNNNASIFNVSSLSTSLLRSNPLRSSMTRLFGRSKNKNSTCGIVDENDEQNCKNKEIVKQRPSISSPRVILTPKRRISCNSLALSASKLNTNATPLVRQTSKLWIESIAPDLVDQMKESLTQRELKRQEAIHELLAGELDLCNDLALIQTTYQNSLIHLEILNHDEAVKIFGDLNKLYSVHYSLICNLNNCRNPTGVFGDVGDTIIQWILKLKIYEHYCSNQRAAKELLEWKIKNDKRMSDFLERCIRSPFSRKLDLWSFLDVPRSRLVKYPLLFQAIQKYTGESCNDYKVISKAIVFMERITKKVDLKMGEAECSLLLSKIEFDKQSKSNYCLNHVKMIICSGNFRSFRGIKLFCILFDNCFAATRIKECGGYILYRKPIPIHEIAFERFNRDKIKANQANSSSNIKSTIRIHSNTNDVCFTLQTSDYFVINSWLINLNKICNKENVQVQESSLKLKSLRITSPDKIQDKTFIYKKLKVSNDDNLSDDSDDSLSNISLIV